MKVKNSAIIYTGYDYQTLQGVKLLAEWLQSPNQYARVAFEAEKDSNETPEGIDDVVCERPNGIRDFWQVKFTPSPEKDENCLTWGWLLKVSGTTARSRSILKKLYDAINAVPAEKLGHVVLLTNKRPNRSMESCLLPSSKIDFNQVDNDSQKEIIRQLGSHEAAIFLFSKLTVQHSDGDYLTIKRSVRSELLKFSDDTGVERLVARAREWAMFKNNPPRNGWVYLHHVREVLSPKRPEPIPEIFSVPEDYCLPNSDFHNDLLTRINHSNGEVITLTGKPGVGKSTYLSFLCQELEGQEVPLIRHHYFLSLGDTTEDRLSPRIVAESLLHQIDSFHKEANASTPHPENLRNALLTCANYYKDKGKPFVVLIDGLDHVWRDNAKNKKPLDETFRQLLPTTENLVVLVGTQPVDDELLPHTLLTHSPKNEWHWLPEMSGNSIYEFLKLHIESGRLFLNCHEDHVDEEIQNSAGALLEATNGYPLHVIYSSEYLSHHGLELSSWQVEKLPPCSDGNITTYYSELWRNLNYRQKDVLHLCSGFQFAWPRQAIGTVVNDNHEYAPSVDSVAHMLSEGVCGVRPFHESLVVFVLNQEEHQERINALLPCVCEWLSLSAPTHLKDNWLWSSWARGGDSSRLRQGVTRDWVLDKLIIGMPVRSCIRLLSEAETYAFQDLEYAEAYRHRTLKTRLINGPEFQTWDSTNLEALSLIIADQASINEIISGQNEYSPTKLSILAIALWYRGLIDQAELLSKKAIDRYRAKTKLLTSRHFQDNDEAAVLIKAGVLTDSLNYETMFKGENFVNWPDEYVASFRRACCIKKDLGLLFRAWQCLSGDSNHIGEIELDAIRLSIVEGADISCRPEYSSFSSQQLSQFLDIFSKKKFSSIETHHFDGQSATAFKVEKTDSYHSWFFASLFTRLNAEGDFSWLPVTATSDQADVSSHCDLLNELIDWLANELLAGNTLNFDVVCTLLPSEPILDEAQWDARRADINLKRDWIEIAADCHLITTKSEITRDELENTIDSGIFRVEWLRLWYKEIGLKLLDDDAVELLIELEDKRQLNELEETVENSNTYLELAQIAFQHDNLAYFERCLRKTWDFVLGYGHHKDRTIFDVLTAVEYLSDADPDSALDILERISPIVFNISKFTDGDETRHSKHSISSLLARLNPQTAASVYEQELSDGEWYYAEETILRLLERCDFSSPITKRLYLTGLHSSCYQILREKIEQENSPAIHIRDEIESLLGIKVQNMAEDKRSSTDELDEKISLQPSDYPPNKFDELTEALKGKYSASEFWKAWYKYWCDQGKECELLQYLMPKASTFVDRFDDKRYLLDFLFFSAKKLEGKAKAFRLLVAAHKAMGGWSDWYERAENSIDRLKVVAEQYPKRIDEFIKLTTSQPDSWKDKLGSLIIPNDKLVFLLSYSGRKDEALTLTLAMVEKLEDDVRNLKLATPAWDWRQDDSLEEALVKLLVSRLKLPIPSIKLWTIDQLSLLLIAQQPRVEELLIEDLANRKQESECVEVLCVFFIAKSKGYVCPNDLGQYIKARSTLSDLMLSELISNPGNFGEYSYPFASLDSGNNRFEYYQGSHVPLLYNSLLKKEERRTGLPFTDHYQSEWNSTFEYQPSTGIAIDYFLGSDRQRATGQFYTQASHRGRSAYLRTIEVAKQLYGMPDSYADQLSIPALPIEPAYMALTPQEPTWLPKWGKENSPDRDSLIDFVEEALENFESEDNTLDLLALSLPIKLDDDHWVDLTVVKAITELESEVDGSIEERSGCLVVGDLLDKTLSYEFDESETPKTTLLAGTPYPFMRYGHWHSDLESRGFYIPKCNVDSKKITGASNDGLFYYSIDNDIVGFSSFWHTNWEPVHPNGVRSLCGSYTVATGDKIEKWLNSNNTNHKSYYACKARLLVSEDSFREFNQEEIEFVIS